MDMKLAIMQPYFFPYIGYWQLINAVDVFVVYDDVNYIKGGWINRNRIISKGKERYFNVPMIGASSNKLINKIYVNNDRKKVISNKNILYEAYRKAPYYSEIMPIIADILNQHEENLAQYLLYQIKVLCIKLGIKTTILRSSERENDKKWKGKGEGRVLNICKALFADVYINPIGGVHLYKAENFQKNKIKLFFLEPKIRYYTQNCESFIPSLSIIDVLMYCGYDGTKKMLDEYELLSGDELEKFHKI